MILFSIFTLMTKILTLALTHNVECDPTVEIKIESAMMNVMNMHLVEIMMKWLCGVQGNTSEILIDDNISIEQVNPNKIIRNRWHLD